MIMGIPFSIIAAPLFSFVATFIAVMWLIKGNLPRVLDYPNARSLHTHPVPRTGGVGLMLGILSTWGLFSVVLPVSVWVGVSLLALISFADDISGMAVWIRLLVQALVAACFSIFVLFDGYGWMAVFLIMVATIWMSNLYNFMDGSDGLAGGMTLIGFGYYGLAAFLAGNNEFAVINFSIAAAATAFLLHNFYPARIFMGDVGSIPLGFLAAVLGVLGWVDGLWSLCFPLIIFSPFIADATVTLIKRSVRGEKIWLAHCEHYYQRIIQSGFGHRNTALFGYALMLVVGASAVWAEQQELTTPYLIGVIIWSIYLIIMVFSDWCQRRRASKG
ncbi:MAG: glycosyltransferase family 4 protein [Nitrosomonas sp.]|nr:glycosyltransferase family 4 protein [Nitrosomonas sp.]MDP1951222.1 glycosyltransferase family 4 protein [Nitrosomonas sp.]